MRHDRLLILGGFLMGAMGATLFAGCSGNSGNNNGAGGGSSGAGGHGAGGSTMDAGTDHGSTGDTGTDTSGAGGSSADAHPDSAADKGSSDAAADMAVDTPTDTGADAGPCVTSFGAGNPVQFAFNLGANGGWTVFQTHYTGNPDPAFTFSLGASFGEGHSCPGALLEGLNFASYGQSGAIEFFYGVSPAGANWTGYKALHAWIKMETATPSEVSGVVFYMKSGNQAFYQSSFAAGSALADWHEVVIDLTRAPTNGTGVMINDVQQIGFETFLNATPAAGAPATPTQVLVLADDIWLEAAPAVDAGTSDAGDAGGQ